MEGKFVLTVSLWQVDKEQGFGLHQQKEKPKQFLSLTTENTMIQETVKKIITVGRGRTYFYLYR